MRARRSLAFAVALIAATPASADAGWLLAGYVGQAWTTGSTMSVERAGAAAVRVEQTYASRSWQPPIYWGARVGRTISRDGRWSVELELIHLKVYARPAALVQRFQLSHGLNFILVNVGFEQPVGRHTSIAVRGGAGPTRPHVEATVGGASRDEYAWGSIGLHAAVGVNVSLTPRVFLTGEVKQTYTRQRLAVGSARVGATFATTHVIAGLGIRFPS
jgi:hypothetical protein